MRVYALTVVDVYDGLEGVTFTSAFFSTRYTNTYTYYMRLYYFFMRIYRNLLTVKKKCKINRQLFYIIIQSTDYVYFYIERYGDICTSMI